VSVESESESTHLIFSSSLTPSLTLSVIVLDEVCGKAFALFFSLLTRTLTHTELSLVRTLSLVLTHSNAIPCLISRSLMFIRKPRILTEKSDLVWSSSLSMTEP